MKHKLQLRTDFCDEMIVKEHHDDTISCTVTKKGQCQITKVEVKSEKNLLQKEIGTYITIEYETLQDYAMRMEIEEAMKEELRLLFNKLTSDCQRVLVVGLGNRDMVSDALGPKCADHIMVTAHFYRENKEDFLQGTRDVAVVSPGVMGQTGLESATIVEQIVKLYEPDLVLVIDALATSSITRINRAIQISDNGIKPGSGVGNHRHELSEKTLHRPVIAIGVATVTSIGTILEEGLVKLKQEEMLKAINEVMDLNLVVTPKNMDSELHYLITIIAEALNHVLHPDYANL